MNKQEVIEAIENERTNCDDTIWGGAYDEAIDDTLAIVRQLDEPEKPVLSKEEAEWLEHLKLIGNFTHCLYVITRQGWGHDFEFYVHEEKYKLSYRDDNDEDSEQTKNRLVNALIYGYEVEKEKRYTAKLKISNEYLSYDKDYKEIRHNRVPDDIAHKVEGYHFTEDDLIAYNAWEIMLMKLKRWKESKLCQIGLREQLN